MVDIAFSQIMEGTRTPGVSTEYNLSGAVNSLPANSYRLVAVGQRLASGSIPAGQVIDVFSSDDAANYFGRGSTVHLAVMDAFKANPNLSLQAVTVDDALAGVAAVGSVTITGPATGSGALTLGVNENTVSIAIGTADTASTIAANLNTQIGAQPNLPITATALAGVVTITAKNKGALGNDIDLSVTLQGAIGVGATVALMTGGLSDPDMSSALTAIYNAGHNIIISCFNDTANLTALRTHLNNVSSPTEKRFARAVVANVSTYASAVTMSSGINSGRILNVLVPNAYESAYEVAAVMAAIAASEPDPARPLNSMELVGLTAPPLPNQLSKLQIEASLHNGVAATKVGPGNVVQIVRAITTYTLNAAGEPDPTLLDWTTLGTLDYVATAIDTAIELQCPRDKKTARSAAKLADVIYEVMVKCQDAEYVQNVQQTDILIVTDPTDPTRTNTRVKVNVVSGQNVIAQVLDLVL